MQTYQSYVQQPEAQAQAYQAPAQAQYQAQPQAYQAQAQYQAQQPQAQAQSQQFHSYNSAPGVQYGQSDFFPNQAALTAAATSFATSAAQQYAQTYQQNQATPQIDTANLAKYSQYLDILQKAYGIQLPGELTMQPNTAGGATAGYSGSQQPTQQVCIVVIRYLAV